MNDRQNLVDVGGVFSNCRTPVFLLNETGRVVFANPALAAFLDDCADFSSAAVRQFLAAPRDLPAGELRHVMRLWGSGGAAKWRCIWYVALAGPDDCPMGVFGLVAANPPPSDQTKAADSIVPERLAQIRERQKAHWGFETIPTQTPAMAKVLEQVRLAIAARVPVLLLGESGVGKLSLAKLTHFQSIGEGGALAVLDSRVLPHSAQRTQLFGRLEPFGMTAPDAAGIFAAPGPGTLIVRGALELPADLQLECVKRFSDAKSGWRIIATEREPLEPALDDGRLTEAFYHAITTLQIRVPALRERLADVPDLCHWLLHRFAVESRTTPPEVEPAAMDLLVAYDWPGNLRELESVLFHAARSAGGRAIGPADLPARLGQPGAVLEPPSPPSPLPELDSALDEFQRSLVRSALERYRGNKSKAAQALKISRPRLLRLCEQLGLAEE